LKTGKIGRIGYNYKEQLEDFYNLNRSLIMQPVVGFNLITLYPRQYNHLGFIKMGMQNVIMLLRKRSAAGGVHKQIYE
jgi:hypothetical protein